MPAAQLRRTSGDPINTDSFISLLEARADRVAAPRDTRAALNVLLS
jgi:hypothetical protein